MYRKIRCDGNLEKFLVFGGTKQGLGSWEQKKEK